LKPLTAPPAPAGFKSPVPPPLVESSPSVGPRKETARISAMPTPPAPPTTRQMAKTQPLMSAPSVAVQHVPINVAAPDQTSASIWDSIPLPFCWGLLAVSTVTLLIQLWIYFS
jgi:hypothetical protein